MRRKLEAFRKKAVYETKADQDLILLTILSSALASYGIKMGNVYVLIGSMLISPIFQPIISTIILAFLEVKPFLKALKSLIITFIVAFAVSIFIWMTVLGIEQVSVAHNLPDILINWDTFTVAFLIGITGMLLWIWPHVENTSVGIAIGISLVPPIAYTSYGIVSFDWSYALSSFKLFMINLVGIILGVCAVILIYSNRPYKKKV